MRKLPILLILAIIVFCSCQKRQDRRLFRWSDLSAETDSIVQSIEQGYINLVHEDSLLARIDQLERETDILKTNPEFPYIFKAKIYYKKGLYDSANILIERADALCDSIKHPYEKQRINIFKSKSQNAYLRNFEFLEGARKYAIQTKDTFLLAITCNSLGVLFNELEDSIQSKDNTNKAIECYKAVNMHRYARSVELNLLVDIFKNGDTALFKSTINAMKADEALMRDSVFRVNLMMDAASYLREDWAIDSLYSITTRPHGLSPVHESKFIAIKADQCRDQGEFKRGYDYSLRSIEIADKSKDIDLMVSLYPHHALFCFLVGMPDSAYLYHQWAFLKMDSIRTADTRTKILRATERYEIEKSVLAKKNEETKRLLIISLVVSAIVILILGFLVWLSIRNGRLKLEAERAKTDTERNRQLLGQTMVRLHQKNQSIIDLSNHIEENIPHKDDLPGLHKEQRILALNEKGDKALETTSKLIDEVSSNLVVNLKKRVPNISKNMIQLAVLIACDIPNKDIAQMLGVQPESIRKQRYRLRTLLNLSREDKLEDVLSSMC